MAETALSPINSSKGVAVPVSSGPHNTTLNQNQHLGGFPGIQGRTNSAAKQSCVMLTTLPHKHSLQLKASPYAEIERLRQQPLSMGQEYSEKVSVLWFEKQLKTLKESNLLCYSIKLA